MALPMACFAFASPSVLFSPAWTSDSICDRLLAVSVCSIEFSSDWDVSHPALLSSSSSRDRILSYASTSLASFFLSSSYALFQSRSGRFAEVDGIVDGDCRGPETVGTDGVEGQVAEGEGAGC